MTPERQAFLNQLAELLVDGSPHAIALGLSCERVGEGDAVMRARYKEELVGDPETGVLHGGVVTALLDHVCGLAAFSGFGGEDMPATLDLRIDYMRPAKPGADVIAEAVCLRSHGLVAVVRATAHDGDVDDPVATAQAAFMITRASVEAKERAQRSIEEGGAANG